MHYCLQHRNMRVFTAISKLAEGLLGNAGGRSGQTLIQARNMVCHGLDSGFRLCVALSLVAMAALTFWMALSIDLVTSGSSES